MKVRSITFATAILCFAAGVVGTSSLRAQSTLTLPTELTKPVDTGSSTTPGLSSTVLDPNAPTPATPTPSPADNTSLLKPGADPRIAKNPKEKTDPNANWLAKGIQKEQQALASDKNGTKANPYDEKKLLDPQQIAKDRAKADGYTAMGATPGKDDDGKTTAAKPNPLLASDSKTSADGKNGTASDFKPVLPGLNQETVKPLLDNQGTTTAATPIPLGNGTAASFQAPDKINADLLAPVNLDTPAPTLVATGGNFNAAFSSPTPIRTSTLSSTTLSGTTLSAPSLPASSGFQSFSSPAYGTSTPASVIAPRPIVSPSIPTAATAPSTAPYRPKVKDPTNFGFGH